MAIVASSLSPAFSSLLPLASRTTKPSFISFANGTAVPSLAVGVVRRRFIPAKAYGLEGDEAKFEEDRSEFYKPDESVDAIDEEEDEEEGEEEEEGEGGGVGSEFSIEISNESKVVAEKPPKKSTSSANGSQQIKTNAHLRIKLKSYWVPLIEDTCKQILEAARTTNAKTVGPVPLPTKKRVYCVLKSPHKHKDAREHFEIRTHIRLIDIVQPTLETVEALSELEFPAGVDVKLKF